MKHKSIDQFGEILCEWYLQNARDLPWRTSKDPYKIWVSEVMLQQTQVERVKEYYRRFLELFPNVESLANAPWEDVMTAWRGLGYYRRARNMQAAAQKITTLYEGKFPGSFNELLELPGFGRYTAAAVASFAFGEDVPAIDTNFHKVMRHVFGVEYWDTLKPLEQFSFAVGMVPRGRSSEFNQGMMDLSSSGILDQVDLHVGCPFAGFCQGVEEFIVRKQRKLKLRDADGLSFKNFDGIRVAIGVVVDERKILISKRRANDSYGGYWEFPGGKARTGEDERTCLKREMMEELGIEVAVRPHFYRTVVEREGMRLLLSFHRCSLLTGEPEAKECDEFLWSSVDELADYQFPPTNYDVIDILKKRPAMLR
jgi:A/G-specific adenine glycosylase